MRNDEPDIPEAMFEAVDRRCLALPEVSVRTDEYAHAYKIRNRIFAYLLAVIDPSGRTIQMLVCQADPIEREALLARGHPYFPPQSGRDRIGIVLHSKTDWDEIGELITESYRMNAPNYLAAQLDAD